MTITVTWDDGVGAPTAFTVPADVYESLENFRQSSPALQVSVPGQGVVPKYTTVKEMIVGVFVQSIVLPALAQFPTPNIQAAQAELQSAQAALQQAKAAAIPGFIV